MSTISLGNTGLTIEQNGFGCLPIQRISAEEAVSLLHRAVDGGMNFFDTAHDYTDSEEKVGRAFAGMRDRVVIATKTSARTASEFWAQLDTSLRRLNMDHIDLYQFHNPAFCPKPGGADGLYDAALEAQAQGKIGHIGITNHRLAVAREAIDSGLYATLQFPYSYLSGPQEEELVDRCVQKGMGFIAMKGMAGGLIRSGVAAAAYLSRRPVVPIWGVQHRWELEEFLSCIKEPPAMTAEFEAIIAKDRQELAGEFCRGCGYCLPCPAGIEINTCARMALILRRMPSVQWDTPENKAKMEQIPNCIHCGQCAARCPYGLDTPQLLADNYADFQAFFAERERLRGE